MKESSEVVEGMGNADEINLCKVNISEEKDAQCVECFEKLSGGRDDCVNDGERDDSLQGAIDGNGQELQNSDVLHKAEVNICDEDFSRKCRTGQC